MNRREALATLMALPEATRISRAVVNPDDVIVVEFQGAMSDQTRARLTALLESVWPGQKCVVLTEGATLKVVAR